MKDFGRSVLKRAGIDSSSRMVNDATVEKEDAHPGKVCLRSWLVYRVNTE